MAGLLDKYFSYKFHYIHILPNSVIQGAAFVWILWASSNNKDGQILHIIENSEKIDHYKFHHSRSHSSEFFIFKISQGGKWGEIKFLKTKNLSKS